MKKTTVFIGVIVLFLFLSVYGYADYSQALQGTWTTSCIDDDGDGIYRKITMTISGNELSSTHEGSWSESECLNNSNFFTSTLTGTFSIGDDIDISEAKELDIIVSSCTITWLTDDIVNYVNANSWYGINDFQKNVPRDISGKTHPNGSTYPSIGETFFSVIKIDENKAYLGTDDAGFILNEDYRSPTLESWFYTKDNSGIITGTVTDENTGNPIENVFVRLLQLSDQQNVIFHKYTYTNAIGEYRLNDIADGSYVIYFNGPDDFNWKLYNNVTNSSTVTWCTIFNSNILSDINAQLSDKCGKISGTVTDEAGNPIPNVTVFAKDPVHGAYYEFAITDQNGHYYISGLSNCKYLIHFVPQSQNYFSEYYNDASHKDMATFISVTEPGLIDNTNAQLDSKSIEPADYFPLSVGNTWLYSPSYGEQGNRKDSIIEEETVNSILTYVWNRQEAADDNYNEKRWISKENSEVKFHKIWGNEGLDPALTIDPPWVIIKLNLKVSW